MISGGARQPSGGSLSNQSIYRNCPRCGDGDVSAEFGSAKSATRWCGVLDSVMAGVVATSSHVHKPNS